jgi:hypothetical protein
MFDAQGNFSVPTIDPSLNGVVPIGLARVAIDSLTQLYDIARKCDAKDDIRKKAILAILVRCMETSYSMLLLMQDSLGATLGLQARSLIECSAEIWGITENPEYLKSWFGKEKDQLEKILKLDLEPTWKQIVQNQHQSIRTLCDQRGWEFDSLPKSSDRGKFIESLGLAGDYKILCLDAHNRPASVLTHHAPKGSLVCFSPTEPWLLVEYLKTMLKCLGCCIGALKMNWLNLKEITLLCDTFRLALPKAVLDATVELAKPYTDSPAGE